MIDEEALDAFYALGSIARSLPNEIQEGRLERHEKLHSLPPYSSPCGNSACAYTGNQRSPFYASLIELFIVDIYLNTQCRTIT